MRFASRRPLTSSVTKIVTLGLKCLSHAVLVICPSVVVFCSSPARLKNNAPRFFSRKWRCEPQLHTRYVRIYQVYFLKHGHIWPDTP